MVTNSTYDGLCYNARRVEELLDPTVDRIHFDEAWYAYARFNPLYRDRHAMHGDPKDHKGPTVFATHSTHKLLAALSQASLLHIRDGRGAIPHSRFNESFMMQASTSPLYADHRLQRHHRGDDGRARRRGPHQRVDPGGGGVPPDDGPGPPRVRREEASGSSTPGTRTTVREKKGKKVAFADASPEFLATEPDAWVLHPGETWHGFGDLEDGYCMLDPIKVSIVTPGRGRQGRARQAGHPGHARHRVPAPARRRGGEDHRLHHPRSSSRSASPRASGARCSTRCSTSSATTTTTPRWPRCCPDLVTSNPEVYGGLGLRDLADQMFATLKETRQTHWLAEAFSTLPTLAMTPSAAYQHLVRDEIEHVPLDKLANRVLATSVVPYPPGIPMLMPGEVTGPADGPVSRLPAGALEVGSALPRVRARYPRHRDPGRRAVRPVPEAGSSRPEGRPTRPAGGGGTCGTADPGSGLNVNLPRRDHRARPAAPGRAPAEVPGHRRRRTAKTSGAPSSTRTSRPKRSSAQAQGLRGHADRGGDGPRPRRARPRDGGGGDPAQAGPLRRRHLGRRLPHRRRSGRGHGAGREEPRRVLRADPAAEPHLGEAPLPCASGSARGGGKGRDRRSASWPALHGREWGGPDILVYFGDPAAPGLP